LVRANRRDGAGPKENSLNSNATGEVTPYGEAVQSNERLRDTPKAPPLIGYMRVSKADGSQVLDLQRDALLAAGVAERHIYSDTASGSKDERLGLAS
jgi:hypothetical protein